MGAPRKPPTIREELRTIKQEAQALSNRADALCDRARNTRDSKPCPVCKTNIFSGEDVEEALIDLDYALQEVRDTAGSVVEYCDEADTQLSFLSKLQQEAL